MDENKIKMIAEVILLCKAYNIEISKEQEGFLAGIQATGNYPKLYTEEQYKAKKWWN